MDPLSITAGIIAVSQAAASLIELLNAVKQASKDQQQLITELCTLQHLLQRLRFRAQDAQTDDPWFSQLKLLGVTGGPLDQFQQPLQDLVSRLTHKNTFDQIKNIVTWSCRKADILELLNRIERIKGSINLALSDDQFVLGLATHNEINALKYRTTRVYERMNDELRASVARWLGIPDPSTNYHAALKKRETGTGAWLLNSEAYRQWKDNSPLIQSVPFMWLHGKRQSRLQAFGNALTGIQRAVVKRLFGMCLKAVRDKTDQSISSTTLEDVLNHVQHSPDKTVAYFFFDFNDTAKQDLSSLIRTILYQLSIYGSFDALTNVYNQCEKGLIQPTDDVLVSLLKQAIARNKRTYIVVDAIDESRQVEPTLSFLTDLVHSQSSKIHLIAFSRPEKVIKDHLTPIVTATVDLESKTVQEDISIYLKKMLQTDPKLCRWPADIRREIQDTLLLKADGMLRQVLNSLPPSLYETYDRILYQIRMEGHLPDAIRILQFLCFSLRPVAVLEVAEILAINLASIPRFIEEERLLDVTHLHTICSSLVCIELVDQRTLGIHYKSEMVQTIRLAHASVHEYLLSGEGFFATSFVRSEVDQMLAEMSLVYLLHISEGDTTGWEAYAQYPYCRYAAEYWWKHARRACYHATPTFIDLVTRLFDDGPHLRTWLLFGDPDLFGFMESDQRIEDMYPSLYYAALTGIPKVVEILLRKNQDTNSCEGHWGSALQVAAYENSLEMVQLLLDSGAHVNTLWRGRMRDNGLANAAYNGNLDMVQLLLGRGADVNADANPETGSPLEAAASKGHDEIVTLFLARGVNVDSASTDSRGNPLYTACYHGHYTTAQILLAHGADVNASGVHHGFALLAALYEHHFDIAWMLIKHGANLGVKSRTTALGAACEAGAEDIFEFILKAGVDVNDCGTHTSALGSAALSGRIDLVQTLLDHGALANVVPEVGACSPLHWTTMYGRDSMVRLLLQHGADINYCCDLHGTPLNMALEYCIGESMTSLLIDHGARSDSEVAFRQEAFEAAVKYGYRRVLDYLLDEAKDCGMDEMKLLLGTALDAALRCHDDELVKRLMDRGADVEMMRRQPKWANGTVPEKCSRFWRSGGTTAGRVIARQQDASRSTA